MRAGHGFMTYDLDRALRVLADTALVIIAACVIFSFAGDHDDLNVAAQAQPRMFADRAP